MTSGFDRFLTKMRGEVVDWFRYHAGLAEPWDGPAGLIFTDGRRSGATLDRNGLRPLRYQLCDDGFVVCASEVGAVPVAGHGKVRRGRLGPGQMLCVDPDGGGFLTDASIKGSLARRARTRSGPPAWPRPSPSPSSHRMDPA